MTGNLNAMTVRLADHVLATQPSAAGLVYAEKAG